MTPWKRVSRALPSCPLTSSSLGSRLARLSAFFSPHPEPRPPPSRETHARGFCAGSRMARGRLPCWYGSGGSSGRVGQRELRRDSDAVRIWAHLSHWREAELLCAGRWPGHLVMASDGLLSMEIDKRAHPGWRDAVSSLYTPALACATSSFASLGACISSIRTLLVSFHLVGR